MEGIEEKTGKEKGGKGMSVSRQFTSVCLSLQSELRLLNMLVIFIAQRSILIMIAMCMSGTASAPMPVCFYKIGFFNSSHTRLDFIA